MYAHLDEVKVEVGQKFAQNDIIALSGNTGLSTGPHLHYSVWRDDELVDPIKYIDLPFTQNIQLALDSN